MELCTQTVATDEFIISRRAGNHHPTAWGDHFLVYADLPVANEEEEKKHEDLKEEVRKMLVMTPSKSLQKLDLINTIQRLGVAYHFEHEIEESLSYMYTHYQEWISEFDGNDLHAISLCFRLLRQQGYYVSCDAFRRLTNDQGNFKKELVNNVHGMLSLYEAAQYRVHGEVILDEALNFTITQLKLILPKLSDSQLAQQVNDALKFSIKDGIVRVETRKYISFYHENEVLLNFAKLDFNILQKLHKKELCEITRWNIDASEQLPLYMKIIYLNLLDVYNEIEKELANENKSFLVNYSIKEIKKMTRAYFQEAKWYHEKKVPTMEKYMKNGIITGGLLLLASTFWLGIGKIATKDAFDWMATEPSILVAGSLIGRLLNDLKSHEEEQKRGDVAKAVECYMNEYNVTKEEAYMKIRNMIENYWNVLNEEYLKLTGVIPRVLLMSIVNFTRAVEFLYKDEDAFTCSKNNLKDVISVMLIDPII
ncbi:terpene synthase 17-like isoform X2 [Capsicum annuum]|uniref:terpene synthase 17-like isoform X2 n=1 Tax=Capsicum annuum TaxID=4072 RepID=UPI001FB0B63E|nr:terpene synthase 17-like isoform X2 [Capsicum annuum]